MVVSRGVCCLDCESRVFSSLKRVGYTWNESRRGLQRLLALTSL